MKRYMLVLLIITLIFSISIAYTADEAADTLVKMKLMAGYPDGTLGLDKNITRAEFCTLVAKMLGISDEENFDINNFSDLPKDHWAYKNVMALASRGIISGYGDGTFKPSNNVTYAETSVILIGVLGYKSELVGEWPTNVMNLADELKLNKDVDITLSDKKMTRGLVSVMLLNGMEIPVKK